MNAQMIQMVIDRVNEMLKDPKINAVYQSKPEEEAKEFIMAAAMYTLFVPVKERK